MDTHWISFRYIPWKINAAEFCWIIVLARCLEVWTCSAMFLMFLSIFNKNIHCTATYKVVFRLFFNKWNEFMGKLMSLSVCKVVANEMDVFNSSKDSFLTSFPLKFHSFLKSRGKIVEYDVSAAVVVPTVDWQGSSSEALNHWSETDWIKGIPNAFLVSTLCPKLLICILEISHEVPKYY